MLLKSNIRQRLKLCLNDKDHFGPPLPLTAEHFVDEWNDEFVKLPFSEFNLDESGMVKTWRSCFLLFSQVIDSLTCQQQQKNATLLEKMGANRTNP